MANVKMATVQAIVGLWRQGGSLRRTARELGIHRETVSRYVAEAEAKPATNPTAGTEGESGPTIAKVTGGISGPKSRCETCQEVIQGELDSALSGQRLWQGSADELRFGATRVSRYPNSPMYCTRLYVKESQLSITSIIATPPKQCLRTVYRSGRRKSRR